MRHIGKQSRVLIILASCVAEFSCEQAAKKTRLTTGYEVVHAPNIDSISDTAAFALLRAEIRHFESLAVGFPQLQRPIRSG
jgi:hypothetical protein